MTILVIIYLAGFSKDLATLAATYDDDIDEDGSVAGVAHRTWMTLEDTISGASSEGVLDAAAQGEDHAMSEYAGALSKDISDSSRAIVERQYQTIKATHQEIKTLRATASQPDPGPPRDPGGATTSCPAPAAASQVGGAPPPSPSTSVEQRFG